MKKITFNLFVLVLIALGAQKVTAQEVILIERGVDDSGKPTLYNAIMGDTTADGERAHPNAIYRLTRGQIYPVENGLYMDFNVTIDALDDNSSNPTRPPMLVPFADDLGELPYSLLISISDNSMTLKNLMFNAVQNPSEKTLGTHAISAKGGRTVIENCVITGFTAAGVDAGGGNGYKVYLLNNIFRNIQSPNAWWEGDPFISWATNGDTLVMRGNTFFNNTGHDVNTNWENAYTNYLEFSHNTVFGGNFNVLASFSITDALIVDNLFVNCYAMGIDTSGERAAWCDADALTSAIVPIDTNDATKMMTDLGLVEADRRAEVHNNVYYWEQGVKDYWASRGAQFPDPVATFMNSRDLAMYADDATWPLLNQSNNIEEDPKMVDQTMSQECIAGYAKYGNELFDSFIGGAAFEGYLHHYPGGDGVDDITFMIEWPLAENLAYSSDVVKKASSTGGPVGALRWMGGPDAIGENNLIAESNLKNYPNPFTSATNISYNLKHSSDVRLSVVNITGQEVAVLVNENQSTGEHSIRWNANDFPAGIYFVKLEMGSQTTTSKMILSK